MLVTYTISVEEFGEARNLICSKCKYRATSITFLVKRKRQGNYKHGEGAHALAKALANGEIPHPMESDSMKGLPRRSLGGD